jgi:hypothetical protein
LGTTLAPSRDTNMIHEALQNLLRTSSTIKLATATHRGAPWLAAAFFVEDGSFAFHVLLETRGRTLANLQSNPRVAVMIENGDAFSLFAQAEGSAQMVEARHDEIGSAIARKTPASATMVALPTLTAVRIEVDCWRLTDVKAGWLPAKELSRSSLTGG